MPAALGLWFVGGRGGFIAVAAAAAGGGVGVGVEDGDGDRRWRPQRRRGGGAWRVGLRPGRRRTRVEEIVVHEPATPAHRFLPSKDVKWNENFLK